MGFTISKADPDVWMRRNGDVYEYIAVYVDDLAIAAKDPQAICDELTDNYKYKLKGVGPISYHLGCDFWRDDDGTLVFGPKKYVGKMMDSFENMFQKKPKVASSPLEKNDHPEMDDTPIAAELDQKKYMSMIGSLQWVTQLGRFDVATPTMTMSRFRVEAREGHLERLKRIYGYLRGTADHAIRVRTELPDRSNLEDVNYDWCYTVYGNVTEILPDDAPEPLGNKVDTTTYVDANLYHDFITGRAVTGILHLVNGTPVDWYTKRQATVETATYSSEFVAARQAVDQIIDLRNTLRYLGVPLAGPSYMFGDNKSVVTSSTIPHSPLSKRHQFLAYHRVREAIASGFLKFLHIAGVTNPADILSKHCGFPQLWPITRTMFTWKGDTADAPDHVETKTKDKANSGTLASNRGECQDGNHEQGSSPSRDEMMSSPTRGTQQASAKTLETSSHNAVRNAKFQKWRNMY